MARTRILKAKPSPKPKPEAPSSVVEGAAPPAPAAKPTSKLGILAELLGRPEGATLAQMVEATGWQAHSVRGAMAGALKARGVVATSTKAEGVRTYRTCPPAVEAGS